MGVEGVEQDLNVRILRVECEKLVDQLGDPNRIPGAEACEELPNYRRIGDCRVDARGDDVKHGGVCCVTPILGRLRKHLRCRLYKVEGAALLDEVPQPVGGWHLLAGLR